MLHVDCHRIVSSDLACPLIALTSLGGVVEDDQAGAEHADGVEDVARLADLRHDPQRRLVQPGVSGLHLLPGLPPQPGVEERELEEGEGGQELEQVFTELGGKICQAGLSLLWVHCQGPLQLR